MKLLRSLLRITATVCICMALIAIVTIVVRPQVLRNWPGDYAADPVVQLTNNFTPVRLAHTSSGALPVVESAPSEANFVRPSDSANSGWVLAESQPAPAESPASGITSRESPTVASESPDAFIPARPTGEEFDPKNVDAAAEPDVQLVPESYTIRAEPQGRVRIEGEDGYSLEASEITLENAPAHGYSNRPSAVSENAGDHTVPEFLRGRDLPPLAPGEKAVTVHVPVDNWVDLSAGDLVDVRSERQGTGVNSDAGAEGTIHIDELERVEIYALPGIAPEDSDTVPVCLKVNSPQARLLIKLRTSKTPVRLMVVKSAHADRAPSPTPSDTRQPLRTADDFADPTPVRTAEPTPVRVQVGGGVDFVVPDADTGPTTADDSPGDPDFPADPTWRDTESRRDPSEPGVAADVAEEPTPADAYRSPSRPSVEQPRARSRGFSDEVATPVEDFEPEESLPAIEPSEVGTVIRLDGSTLRMTADGVQIVESELRIRRVGGFDPKIIRVSALRPTLLKIEALAQGQTSFRVEYDSAALYGMVDPALGKIDVEVAPKPNSAGVKSHAAEATPYNTSRATMDARPLTSGQSPQDEAEETLRKLYPNSGLEFLWLRDALVVRGWVANAGEIPQIIEIAEQYAPKVFNQIAVKLPERDRTVNISLALPPQKTLGDGEWEQQRVDVVRLGTAQTPAALIVEDAALTKIINEQLVELAVTKDQAVLLGWLGDEPLVVVPYLLDREAAQRLIHRLPRRESTNAGDHGRAGASMAPFAPGQSITLPRECKVTLNPRGKLDLASCASCHQAAAPLDAATGPANDPLRDDIHALHDDVRKLIALLEKRTAVQPPAVEGLKPEAAARQEMFNEWGRAVLRKDFARALAVADGFVAKDTDHRTYKAYAEKAREAISTGNINHPMLVVAMMKGPACDEVQPLLTRRQNSGLPMVVLNAEAVADADLIQQLKIESFPTLVWTVDGTTLVGQVGVFTEADFNRMFRDAVNTWGRGIGDKHAGELLLPDPQANSPSTETREELHTAPAPPATAPQAPQSPPESMTDGKRPNSVDRETAEFLDRTWWLIGFRFTPVPEDAPQLRDRFVRGGLLIDEVRPDSPAAKATLAPGDVIIGVRKWETTDSEDLRYAINQATIEGVWDVQFHFVRDGRRLSTQVAFEMNELETPPHGTIESARLQPEGAADRVLGLNPTAAARKKLLDEIGRVILRRDYPRALELAEIYQAADSKTEFAAIKKIGPENVPVLAVATAKWSAPCQKLQPLLTKLQNDGYGLVILDSDAAADAELIGQLKIDAFPTLACVVDGSKKGELVGVFNQTRFDQFFNQFGDTIQEMLDKLESDAGESKPDIEADIPAATTQSVRESDGDARAIDFNRTFNFSVGFAR